MDIMNHTLDCQIKWEHNKARFSELHVLAFVVSIVSLLRYVNFKRIVISYLWIRDLLTSRRGKRKLMHTHKPALNTKKVMWRGRLVEIRSACNVLIDFFFRNSNFQLSFVSSIMYFYIKEAISKSPWQHWFWLSWLSYVEF